MIKLPKSERNKNINKKMLLSVIGLAFISFISFPMVSAADQYADQFSNALQRAHKLEKAIDAAIKDIERDFEYKKNKVYREIHNENPAEMEEKLAEDGNHNEWETALYDTSKNYPTPEEEEVAQEEFNNVLFRLQVEANEALEDFCKAEKERKRLLENYL